MTFPEYEDYDGLGLAALVSKGEVSAAELLEAAIERIEARDGELGAFVIRMYAAARSTVVAGLPSGPFTGVPFALKDLAVYSAGVPTTGGNRLFRDFVPDHDSAIVHRYRQAGLVILGKTKTPELGASLTTEPLLYGPAHNPWNLDYSPGGSSGGSAEPLAADEPGVAVENVGPVDAVVTTIIDALVSNEP